MGDRLRPVSCELPLEIFKDHLRRPQHMSITRSTDAKAKANSKR